MKDMMLARGQLFLGIVCSYVCLCVCVCVCVGSYVCLCVDKIMGELNNEITVN